MREKWARKIVFITGLLVILLAVIFARIQNPGKHSEHRQSQLPPLPAEQSKSLSRDTKRIEAGRLVYQQQTCANCHSIAGKGNPRIPLDGVAERLDAGELLDWMTGGDPVKGKLPDYAFRTKQTYKKLSEEDLDALLAYLQSLRRN